VPLRDDMVGETETQLLVLMASAGLVLLIACANLAGALLSRMLSRRREFAVRLALGAGRARLVRQLLTESTLLALTGGALGLLLAVLALGALRGLAIQALPSYAVLSLDPGTIAAAALLALATGIALGIAPALSVGRGGGGAMLREEGRGSSEGRRSRHVRGTLVAGQIALSVSMLAGAGLLMRSLIAMSGAPLGFDPAGVLTATIQLPDGRYGSVAARTRFHEQLEARLRAVPGIEGVAVASSRPGAVLSNEGFSVEGRASAPGDAKPFVLYASVTDGYFRTVGIPLLRGRTFEARDRADAPPVVVISEAMARRHWPGGDALGARIRLGPDPDAPAAEVIGVVGDVRNGVARLDAEPMLYASTRRDPWASLLLVRTQGDPLGLVRAIERELAQLDPALPLHDVATLPALLADGMAGRRLPTLLVAGFGTLALLLASVGVYAMFAAMVAAREREFGIRLALGSSPREIAGLVLRAGALWMAVGLVSGAVGVVAVARLVRGLLYGVAAFDPVSLGGAVLVLLGCAGIALLVPIRRATRVDPITAMRA
jgi:predicted permease